MQVLIGDFLIRFVEFDDMKFLPLALHLAFKYTLSDRHKGILAKRGCDRLHRLIRQCKESALVTQPGRVPKSTVGDAEQTGNRDVSSPKNKKPKRGLVATLYDVTGEGALALLAADQKMCSGDRFNEEWYLTKFDFILEWLRR